MPKPEVKALACSVSRPSEKFLIEPSKKVPLTALRLKDEKPLTVRAAPSIPNFA